MIFAKENWVKKIQNFVQHVFVFINLYLAVKVEKDTDFNKMRIKDLKKILADRGVPCKGCLEKSDYIKKIQETEL